MCFTHVLCFFFTFCFVPFCMCSFMFFIFHNFTYLFIHLYKFHTCLQSFMSFWTFLYIFIFFIFVHAYTFLHMFFNTCFICFYTCFAQFYTFLHPTCGAHGESKTHAENTREPLENEGNHGDAGENFREIIVLAKTRGKAWGNHGKNKAATWGIHETASEPMGNPGATMWNHGKPCCIIQNQIDEREQQTSLCLGESLFGCPSKGLRPLSQTSLLVVQTPVLEKAFLGRLKTRN